MSILLLFLTFLSCSSVSGLRWDPQPFAVNNLQQHTTVAFPIATLIPSQLMNCNDEGNDTSAPAIVELLCSLTSSGNSDIAPQLIYFYGGVG